MEHAGAARRRRAGDAARPVGRFRRRAHGARGGEPRRHRRLHLCLHGRQFPSVGAIHPPAIRLERTIRDLFGLEPVRRGRLAALARPRPVGGPRSRSATASERRPARALYAFLPAEGESLHQIPVGPVHAGIIEPGHFRFTASGETVVRLEERLGYVHKGIEGLMAGAPIARGAQLAGRTSGDSTVAYALAFRARRRGGARHRGAAAGRVAARADGRDWSGSPIISAISAPSATTPPSR